MTQFSFEKTQQKLPATPGRGADMRSPLHHCGNRVGGGLIFLAAIAVLLAYLTLTHRDEDIPAEVGG